MSVASCIVEGGDDRLTILASTRMNKYNVPIVPTPGVCRGSCTSSQPSPQAFAAGTPALSRIARDGPVAFAADLRNRLRAAWGFGLENGKGSVAINFFPSGTDAELLFGILALGRAMELSSSGRVLTVVACAGEVGSGTTDAAAGRHFSTLLPSGAAAKPGSSIFLDSGQRLWHAETKLRSEDGTLRPETDIDAEVESLVARALESEEATVCVLHLVSGCKTGHASPSPQIVAKLRARFGTRILPVLDGCQCRLQDGVIRDFVAAGYGVLVTGSKFYGGPPFSGAAMLGRGLVDEFEGYLQKDDLCNLLQRSTLHAYLSAPLVDPDHLPSLCMLLPKTGSMDRGVLLRWAMALVHIEEYHSFPAADRDMIMATWVAQVRSLVAGMGSPAVAVLEEQSSPCTAAAGVMLTNTIISLQCQVKIAGNWHSPSVDELRHVHRLMALDLSYQCHSHGKEVDVQIAKRCFIAQPVVLGKSCAPVLRVAIGAPQIVEAHKEMQSLGNAELALRRITDEDHLVLKKLVDLLEGWDVWSGKDEAVASPVEAVKADFREQDRQMCGSISVQHLKLVLQGLDPTFPNSDLDKLFHAFLQVHGGDIDNRTVDVDQFMAFLWSC